jgi:uncharacterized protein (DUF58 family)
MMNSKLLDSGDYELIRQLGLSVKRKAAGLVTGEQRSPIRGGGIEFADYREYIPGDDIRQVDWTVYLRLRKLLVKLCAEEKELTLMLIIDNSRSMNFGNPDKLTYAKKICGILAGIAVHNGNRCGVVTLGRKITEVLLPQRNRISLDGIMDSISGIEIAESISPVACMKGFSSKYGKKCMAVFVSDLLFPEWPQMIKGLSASGSESHVIQLLSGAELEPPLFGEVTLVDIEDGTNIPLHIDYETLRRYNSYMNGFLNDVRLICHKQNIGYSMARTDMSIRRIFHQDLRKGGLLC